MDIYIFLWLLYINFQDMYSYIFYIMDVNIDLHKQIIKLDS